MNRMPDEVRTFTPEHLEGCARLYAVTFREGPWNEAWTEDSALERLSQVTQSPGFYGLVALREEEVIGLAFGYRRRRPSGDFFLLDEMCVEAGTQRSGVGNWLIARLRQDLADDGVSRVVLLTAGDSPARHFYEKNGFREDEGWILMIYDPPPNES